MVKEVIYSSHFEKVQLETISLVCNPAYHDKGFKHALLTVVSRVCQQFHGSKAVIATHDREVIKNVLYQTPRLPLMPLLEDLVQEHLRLTFASSIGKFVAMGFYSGSDAGYGQPGEDTYIHTGHIIPRR